MLGKLDQLVEDVGALQAKLVLLIGGPGSGKSALLNSLGKSRGVGVLNVGIELGRRLSSIPQKRRCHHANTILRELAEQQTKEGLLLLDNIELLFDRTLKLDPLDLLKHNAHEQRVVAVWPSELNNGRLTYAEMGHAEHQDYGSEGYVPFVLQ